MNSTVVHNAAAQRFEIEIDGARAVCDYRIAGRTVDLHHTEVPAALQGRGIAADLVAATLQWAREQGYTVRPSCSYVASYMRRHPQTADLLAG